MILCRDRDLGQLLYNPEVLPQHVRATVQPHALEGTRVLRLVRSLFVGAVHSWPVDLVLLLYV
jgi:hypothetical protein